MSTSRSPYIFVPGSFHGAWCFYKVLPLLRANGLQAMAIDLPAHGKDKTPVNAVTLDSYVNAVCSEVEKYDEPVILVGHSRAGIVISQVAERIPEKIKHLVYLTAYLIPNGEPMVATAMSDADSVLATNLIFNEAEGWHMPRQDKLREAFYHDCSEEDVALAESLVSHEPNLPVVTPLQLSEERYGKVNKVYIEALQDKAITHQLQKRMLERTAVDKTFVMETSHSPFLSKPKELVEILLSIR
ncbi:MAG: alpha/beta fold hydrolase [Bacteroidetes bacterium]|nr:alpha/beta fold hydrolase [Bacteroidota bacterium]